MGKVKPITKNFIQHKSNLRKKKYRLNKKLIKKKEIFEKYLNTHCHRVNLIKFIFGNISIKKVMTKNPIAVTMDTLAAKALRIMNEKKITSLCVFKKNKKKKTVGLIHIHHLLKANIE